MGIGKQVVDQLRKLADGDRTILDPDAAGTLRASDQGLSAKLEIFDQDRYSVTLRALTVGAEGPPPADARAYLSAVAAEVARGLSFLEEPLAVWELDGRERLAQLRSSPPLREPSTGAGQGGEEVSYWEITLWAGEQPGAQAMRYRWAPGMAEREPVAYPATFALIGRMADALAAALASARA